MENCYSLSAKLREGLSNLTLFRPNPVWRTQANIADPVQTPQNAASDQGLHCLLTDISMQNTITMKTSARIPSTCNGLIQMLKTDKFTDQRRINQPLSGYVL